MELDIETLTQEQKKQLDMWYKIYLNENNKMVIEEPIEITPEFLKYKTEIINQSFQNSINQFTSNYSQAEIDTWKLKEEEAIKTLESWWTTFINNLCIEWETPEELATKILANADIFKTAYAEAEKIKRQKLKDLTI